MSLPSSMADFVPCDRLLQKAYLLLYFATIYICIHVTNTHAHTEIVQILRPYELVTLRYFCLNQGE